MAGNGTGAAALRWWINCSVASGAVDSPGAHVSPRWAQWRAAIDLDDYDRRWVEMAERGEAVHGEADLVTRMAPRSVLDAGCGTGRIAIELDRRGIHVVGVDLDPDMIAAARRKAPELDWHVADLSAVALERDFELVLMAGNILLFCQPEVRRPILANLAGHLADDAPLVAGMSVERTYTVEHFDADAAAAGLEVVERLATWHGDPFTGGDYHVSILRRR